MRQIFLENDITFESLITNPISIFMAMFMPILVIFPFLNVFWNEKMTNNYLFRHARIDVRKYIVEVWPRLFCPVVCLLCLGVFCMKEFCL